MADHITEEEQVEAFKRWWKENGTSLLIGVVLAVGGYFGWQTWQGQQQQEREMASALYEDMMDAGIVDPGQQLTDEQRSKVNSIAEELIENYDGGLYAHNAAMLLAKIAVEDNRLADAEQHLSWVLNDGPGDSVKAVVTLRLATVLYAQDNLDAALELVGVAPDTSFTSSFAEIRGDILLAKNLLGEAKLAYQSSVDNLLQSQNSRRDIIQMKLDDVVSTLAENSPVVVEDSPVAAENEPVETDQESSANSKSSNNEGPSQ